MPVAFKSYLRVSTEIKRRVYRRLQKKNAYKAARIKTEIKNLSHDDFILLFRLGFEVADATLHAFGKNEYQLLGYDSDQWAERFRS